MNKLSTISPKKIGVFRALQLGDLLCAIPAIRALKFAYPASEITLIGMPWAESFANRFSHYFSEFTMFPGMPGLPEQQFRIDRFIPFLQIANHQKFDLVIQMHGNGTIINPMIEMLGARYTAGYYLPECSYCPDPDLYLPYPEKLSEVQRHLSLISFLGIQDQGDHLELPVFEEEREEFDRLIAREELTDKKYVVIHTGARDERRCWPLKNFAFMADKIAEKGYKIVFTGMGVEVDKILALKEMMKYPSIDLAGKTKLGTLGLLVKNAELVLANDTGISHVSVALKTPSVIIFLASDPERWAPSNRNLHRAILPHEADNLEYIEWNIDEALKKVEIGEENINTEKKT